MSEQEVRNKVEALLFALGRPLSLVELSTILGVDEGGVRMAIKGGGERGVTLVDDGRMIEMRIGGAYAELVENARKEEFAREVGRAGLEVLSAVLYRGVLSRAEIDFIRGVNSSQTLRTLTMRGLLRRVSNPRDERSFLYEPTTELLAYLGVESAEDLPEYDKVRQELTELEQAYRANEKP
jgi:segregation and condensation protein B